MDKQYKSIAVDFDGTLSFGRWPEVGEPNTELISFLKRRSNMAAILAKFVVTTITRRYCMTRVDAQIRLSAYLKSHLIYFEKDFYDGIPRFTMMFKNCGNCVDKLAKGER